MKLNALSKGRMPVRIALPDLWDHYSSNTIIYRQLRDRVRGNINRDQRSDILANAMVRNARMISASLQETRYGRLFSEHQEKNNV